MAAPVPLASSWTPGNLSETKEQGQQGTTLIFEAVVIYALT